MFAELGQCDISLAATVERRQESRSEPACEIIPSVDSPRGALRGRVVNISASGNACLLFDTNPGVKVGTKVFVCYETTREAGVVRHVSVELGEYRVGIELCDTGPVLR